MSAQFLTSRPVRARIDGSALRHNYARAKQAAPHSQAWAVVKADAYGHGLWRAVEALRDVADGFALLEVENGVALREAGVAQPILLLEGLFAERDIPLLREFRLTSVVHCLEQLRMLVAAGGQGEGLSLYLKANTGMNRLGFTQRDMSQVRALLARLPAAELTWMTHFSDADGETGVASQMGRFREQIDGWEGAISLANSAAILRHPGAHGDWVRPGIMLYGGSPFAGEAASIFGLRPVMTLESSLIAVQSLQGGDRVGYGGTYVADGPMRVGVVACGYADGYPRHAPTGTPVAVAGQRTRTLGRVSMDMLAVDLTRIPEVGIGAPVTLWGSGQAGQVAADEVAAAAGTISYELFCALAPRVPVIVDA
ncbi:MAG TPA: alanine racemase [Rhodocyclaceae bacterium]|nr:alanine racemase [Rhodocyclaceae bacterium]